MNLITARRVLAVSAFILTLLALLTVLPASPTIAIGLLLVAVAVML